MTNLKNSASSKIDKNPKTITDLATFGMGCYWDPDARFGALKGVVGTISGEIMQIEVNQVKFDLEHISYPQMLDIFMDNHDPFSPPPTKMYQPAVFYHNRKQKEYVERVFEEINLKDSRHLTTKIYPISELIPAPNSGQKYYLHRYSNIYNELNNMFSSEVKMLNSQIAARINGYLAGYGDENEMENELKRVELSPGSVQAIKDILSEMKNANIS